MRKIIKSVAICLMISLSFVVRSQISYDGVVKGLHTFINNDSLKGFNEQYYKQDAMQRGFFGKEYNVYMYQSKKAYINSKYNLVTTPPYGSNFKPGTGGGGTINSAPCVNEDFEASPLGAVGTVLAGWTINQGQNATVNGSCTMIGCCPNPNSNAWIRATPWVDPGPMGTIPASPLGGTKIIQMNDNIASTGEMVRIQQTFPVTSTNALFQFAYMAAMDGSGHLCCDQPFLKITVLNCANVPLACPSVSITPPGSSCVSTVPAGWFTNTSGVSYCTGWQQHSLDLTPYIGSCVTIQVTVSDCDGWAHYGYTYFDALCSPMTVQVNNNLFPAGSNVVFASACGVANATVTAPPGLGPYIWNGPGGSGITNNPNQTFTTNVTGNYTLTMNPVGSCAPITKTVNLSFGVNPTSGFTKVNVCNNYTFTNTGSASPAIQTYSFIGAGAPASYTTTNPTSSVIFNNPGTYTLQQVVTNTAGCTSTATQVVTVASGPTLTVNSPSICPGSIANLSVAGAITYTWSGPGLSANNIPNPTATTGVTTTYTVSGTNGIGCTSTTTLLVTALPSPTIIVNSPSMCIGSSSVVTAAGANTYVWSPATGLSANNIANPTASPLATTVYTITGTGLNGCISTQTSTVTVNPLPILSTTSSTICPGKTATLTVSGASTYSWSTGSLTSSITASPVTQTIYTVTGTSAFGCVSVATSTIAIQANLVVNIANNGPICSGSTLSLTTTNAIPTWTCSWNGPGFISNIQNPSIPSSSVANAGTYTVNVIDQFGCIGTASMTAVVNPLPNPTASNNSAICANQTLNLNANGGVSYSWTGPGFSSLSQNPIITSATTLMSGTYTVNVTDANGCSKTTTTSVLINPLPIVSIGGSTVCSGANVLLTSNGGVSYSWSGPVGYTSSSQNPVIINSNSNMSGNYVVTVTDVNGCVNANMVNVIVTPPFTITATNNGPICQGGQLNLSTMSGYAYSWSGPGFSSNLNTPSINGVPLSATGIYTVVATDAGGCQGVATTIVNINPNPIISISSGKANVCAPACVTFTLNSSTSVSNVSWFFENGSGVTTSTTTQCFNKGGIYTSTATVIDNNGCIGGTTHTIELYPTPTADFIFAPLRPITDNEITFTDASFGANITEWYWFFNSQSVNSTFQNPKYTYSEVGPYAVTLIVKSDKGCMDTITQLIVIGEDYGIYVPNSFTPNNDGLNDTFSAKGYGITKFEMSIYDRWGEKIFTTSDIHNAWDGTYKGVLCKEDSYTWKIDLTNTFGKSKELTGHVTLIK